MGKQFKNERILDMYVRLCGGKCICKAEEADRFGVDERSIQRDIDDIRAFLGDQEVEEAAQHRKVIYDRNDKCFRMTGVQDALTSNSEILAVSKILLESRAFTKQEINSILDKLIAGCTPQENMKLVTELVANEKYHYVDLHDKSSIQDRLSEQTKKSTEEITKITNELNQNTKDVVNSIDSSLEATTLQNEKIAVAADSFTQLDENMVQLIDNINTIDRQITGLSDSNNQIVDNISQLSAATQQVTASAEQVKSMSEQNLLHVEEVKQAMEIIRSTSDRMNQYM